MNIRINTYWLTGLLVLVSLLTTNAQVTLNLYYSDPAFSTDTAFTGTVLRAGAESGDAAFFAKFSGTGTRYFEIYSPVERITKQVSSDGYVSIRPDTSTIINASKIKSFSGIVKDSIVVTVKPLSLTTINTNLTADVLPGSDIITYYRTGAGTFPAGLIAKKFKVQLVDATGKFVADLVNPVDQYSGREQRSISAGGTRSIKATLPASLTAGTYRVQVVTQGLVANVSGTTSSTFTVKASVSVVTTIIASSVSGTYCVGSTVSFPFSTTGTFPTGNAFKVQLIDANGAIFSSLSGASSASAVSATLPDTLLTGTYRFQIAATAASVLSNTGTIGIAALPVLTISGSSTITTGSAAPVRLAFTGTPPWSFTYTDNTTSRAASTTASSTTITPTFTASTVYDKSFIKGFGDKYCAVSSVINGAAQITVVSLTSSLTLTTGMVSGSLCPGSTIPVSFTANGTLPTGIVYQAQLSDAAGSFTATQSIGTGSSSPVSATLPASLGAGTGYRIQVIVQKPTIPGAIDYSGLVTPVPASLLISRPDVPKVTSLSTCSGTATVPFSATGTNLKWYQNVTGGTPNTSTPVFSSQTATVATYYVTQSDGAGCESVRQPVSISVIATPSAPSINSLTLCQNQMTPGFPNTLPNLTWYPAATGGGGTPQPPVINTQNAGEQTVYVSQTVNGCESLRATVKATVNVIPPAPTIQPPTTLCQNASASPLTATGSSGSTLTWYGPSGKLPGAPTPVTSASGVQSFSVSQTVNMCESLTAVTTVTITPAPASPTVNSVSYCSSGTTGSFPSTSTNLRWYGQSNGGTFSSSPPVFSLATPTTLTFYVSQTNGLGCESARQPVSVSIAATPSAPSITSITLCEGKSGQFTSSIPGILWYKSLTDTVGTAQPPGIDNQTAGEQTFYVTQTINGCRSPKASVKAIVNKIPEIPTVQSSLSLCQNTAASSLTATGFSLTWYGPTGQLPVAPTPVTSASGVQSYSVTQSVSGCESPKALISVQVNPAPNPPGVNTVQYCVGTGATSLTASGNNLKWYETSSGSQALTGAPTPPTIQPGVLQYYVSQTVNGCESARQPLSVSINAASPAPTVSSVTLCQGQSGQFTSSIPNAKWYTAATGGTGTPQPPVPNNQAIGEQTFYVTQNTNGCESMRVAVKATVYQLPSAPNVQSSVSLCQNASAGALTASGTGGLIWYNPAGAMLPGAPTPGTSASGVQSFSVSQTVNGCEGPRTTVNVVVLAAPDAPVVLSERYCVGENSRPLSVTTSAGFIRKWYTSPSGGTGSTIEPGVFTQSSVVNTYYVTQTDGNMCESGRSPVTVSVVAPPSVPTVTANQLVCQLSSVMALTASPNAGLVWQGSGITGSSETAPMPSTSNPGTFTYTVAQKAGSCTSSAAQILFTVNPTPAAPTVQSPAVFCVGTASVPLSATGTKLTWYTKDDRAGPTSSQVMPNTSQTGVTSYYVTQKDGNNCESLPSKVEVRVSTKATARLTGDGFVNPGDSTAIRIHLTGDAPWTFTDWKNLPVTLTNSSDSLHVIWVTPKQAVTTYAITNLQSTCGAGDAGAPYVLRFSAPLAIQPVIEPLSVKAYPNPTTGDLTVDWSSPTRQTVTLEVIDAAGNAIRRVIRQSAPTRQTDVFHLDTQPAGLYFLRIKTPTNGAVIKPIVKH